MVLLHVIILQNKKHLKNVGPIRHASRRTPIQQVSLLVLSRAACASMSTMTTRDKGTAMAPWNGPNNGISGQHSAGKLLYCQIT